MVDGADAPKARRTRGIDEIEPGQRAVLDHKAQRRLWLETQRQGQGGPDGAAVGHGNDIAAAVLGGEAVDRPAHALDEIDEALAAGGALVRGGEPERVRAHFSFRVERLALEPLPFAQVLLGELGNRDELSSAVLCLVGRQDRGGRLARAREVAGEPDRIGRQLVRQCGEDVARRAVAVEIALAIDAPAIGDGSMSDPPPARLIGRHPRYSIVTTILPMALRAPSRAIASPARASG